MLDFLQSRNALAGKKLRELELKNEPIPASVPDNLRRKSAGRLGRMTCQAI